MDEKAARALLEEAKTKLVSIEEQREVWLAAVQMAEGWLRVYGSAEKPTVQSSLPGLAKRSRGRRSSQKGDVSLRSAILQVLKDARGAQLHSKEILNRVRGLGADTKAKDPVGIIDLVAINLKTRSDTPIERVAPRTWRWAGDLETNGR